MESSSEFSISIRPYDAETDAASVRRAFIELQEAERALDPHMPPGERVVDAYLESLFDQCERTKGRIYVAVEDRTCQVAGYVAVLGEVPSDEPDDDPSPYAYLSDLVVLSDFRGRGVARQLTAMAESHARELGMPRIRLQAMARNMAARRLYERAGYTDHIVQMEKRFRTD